jgi:HEAT repeat protein
MDKTGEISDIIPIGDLIEDLGKTSFQERHQARLLLVQRGRESIPALIEALSSPNRHIRWGAVQSLGEIQAPDTAPILVEMLKDDDPGVRWAARDSLIRMGRHSIQPLLEKYIDDIGSIRIRKGTHHILRALKDNQELEIFEIPELEELMEIIPGDWDPTITSKQLMTARRALDEIEKAAISGSIHIP